MSAKTQTTVQTLVAAVVTILVQKGVLGGEQADSVQVAVTALITIIAGIGIHSLRKPKA